jgi:hypothetical protein
VEILEIESSGAANTERETLQRFCAGLISEMQSVSNMIFNNKQVTCVEAYVMGTSLEEEATIR